jgi:hypothetical protein
MNEAFSPTPASLLHVEQLAWVVGLPVVGGALQARRRQVRDREIEEAHHDVDPSDLPAARSVWSWTAEAARRQRDAIRGALVAPGPADGGVRRMVPLAVLVIAAVLSVTGGLLLSLVSQTLSWFIYLSGFGMWHTGLLAGPTYLGLVVLVAGAGLATALAPVTVAGLHRALSSLRRPRRGPTTTEAD